MDRLEALGSQLSKITMYDIKSAYNQAKNMVLNVSEMEAKVQEATNDDPWGASSTLMGEIAQGTFNFQQFNEIMPAIYSRFMDKEAREWRQIYKSLQLLEYIIKHGSERVVDDARSHLSTIKMLRNFHYIDEKGKDQGINVRNRAKEIAELLSDLDRVRQERRKAKVNRNKYTGTGNDGGGFGNSGSRYGGFSSDDYYSGGAGGSYSGSSYSGGGGAYSGGGGSRFSDTQSKKQFEEYDAGDWEDSTAKSSAHRQSSSVSSSTRAPPKASGPESPAKPAVPAKDKAKEVDLLGGFDDDVSAAAPSTQVPAAHAPVAGQATQAVDDFDDFDDFKSAPTNNATTSTAPAIQPAQPVQSRLPQAGGTDVFALLNATSSAPTSAPAPMFGGAPAMGMGQAPLMARPSYTTSGSGSGSGMGMNAPLMATSTATMLPSQYNPAMANTGGRATPTQAQNQGRATPTPAAKSSANFDDLWASSLSSTGRTATNSTSSGGAAGGAGKSIMDLQKEKQQAAFWGSQARQPGSQGMMGMGGGDRKSVV